jgi:hypothetical protein
MDMVAFVGQPDTADEGVIKTVSMLSTAEILSHIRRTAAPEELGSVYDVIKLVTGCNGSQTTQRWRDFVVQYPEVAQRVVSRFLHSELGTIACL